MIELDQVGSIRGWNLIKLGQSLNGMKLNQVGSNWMKLNQIESNWFTLIKLVAVRSN